MDSIIGFVKIIAIIQLILIILFLLLNYIVSLYFNYKKSNNLKWLNKVKVLLSGYYTTREKISEADIQLLAQHHEQSFIVLEELKNQHGKSDAFAQFSDMLGKLVFHPVAHNLALSHSWIKHFKALQYFNLYHDDTDLPLILKFINTGNLLLQLNASLLAIEWENNNLIDALISVYAQKRRVQQSIFAEVLAKSKHNISPALLERLNTEKNIYVRILCYRLLCNYPQTTPSPIINMDIKSDSIDLKIAVIHYIAHCEDQQSKEQFFAFIDDPHWEVRAQIATSLHTVNTEKSLETLTRYLSDTNHWVRTNASYSLYAMGEKGKNILLNQSPGRDQYAYEAAQYILKTKG